MYVHGASFENYSEYNVSNTKLLVQYQIHVEVLYINNVFFQYFL